MYCIIAIVPEGFAPFIDLSNETTRPCRPAIFCFNMAAAEIFILYLEPQFTNSAAKEIHEACLVLITTKLCDAWIDTMGSLFFKTKSWGLFREFGWCRTGGMAQYSCHSAIERSLALLGVDNHGKGQRCTRECVLYFHYTCRIGGIGWIPNLLLSILTWLELCRRIH